MHRLIFTMTILVATIPLTLNAQKYGTTLGFRFGNDSYRTAGITVGQRLMKRVTTEGIVQSDFKYNHTAHLLVKRHHPALTKRLNAYIGTGLSMGMEQSTDKDQGTRELVTTYDNPTIGVDLMAGLEFTILGYNLSLDYKPNLNLLGRGNWYQGQVGISARSVLVKDKQWRKKQRKKSRAKNKDKDRR